MNSTTTPTPTITFDEPWKVREDDLAAEPMICTTTAGDAWMHQSWSLVGATSTTQLAVVKFATSMGPYDSCIYGPPTFRAQAIKIRDRIIACVNACTGMEDPTVAIPALRARIADLEAEVTRLTQVADVARRLVEL